MAEAEELYETLALGQVEETYDTLQTKTRKEKDLLRMLRFDIRRNKRFGGGLGVFCVVLALLNVAVPLHLHQSNMVERQLLMSRLEQIQNTNLNLTEKKGQLETSLDLFKTISDLLKTSYDQLETRCDQLNTSCDKLETRCDQLKASYDKLETSCDKLKASYDKLETIRYELPIGERENMAKERDELKMRLCESPGWQKFDGGCYYISTEEKTWEESRQWCRDRQSDLVVIKSKEEQDFVVSLVTKATGVNYVWLGLTDSAVEGSFVWVDGTPLTTPTYWRPGEPDSESTGLPNAERDCVRYYDGSESGYPNPGWYDTLCSFNRHWICERSLC